MKLKYPIILFVLLALLVAPLELALASQPAATIPTISIVSVVKDTSVIISTKNFPANVTFKVRMGKIGTKGINGIVVGETDSGKGGTFEATYNIPEALKGQELIAIRMDGTGGYYSYNWFVNGSTAQPTAGPTATPGGPTATPRPRYSGIPTFSILSVVKDNSVTIRTKNFPAGMTFTVRMGKYGTLGIGGVNVGSVDSGSGGVFEATFNIPDSLKGQGRIAIRLQSSSGYYAYNWFYNSSTGASPTATPGPSPTPGPTSTPKPTQKPGYSGIPTFTIIGVVRDGSVTIRTKNFPPDLTFTARMGKYGTLGVGGTNVGTLESGEGGAFEATFDIPEGLQGSSRIAIRLESTSGYYAYNWFYNSNYP